MIGPKLQFIKYVTTHILNLSVVCVIPPLYSSTNSSIHRTFTLWENSNLKTCLSVIRHKHIFKINQKKNVFFKIVSNGVWHDANSLGRIVIQENSDSSLLAFPRAKALQRCKYRFSGFNQL